MKRTAACSAAIMGALLGIATLWPSARVPGIANVNARHRGCSNANVKGTYAFQRTGINQVIGGPIAIIGTVTFDGTGNVTASRQAASRNGVIQDWTDTTGGGTYQIDPDCTGAEFDATGAKTEDIVVLDGGEQIVAISTLSGRIITAVIRKIERDE
jgi:hypothetical protein